MRSQQSPSRWLIAPTLFLAFCSQGTAPHLAGPSSTEAQASTPGGAAGASDAGDVRVGGGALDLVRLRLDRQSSPGVSVLRQYANAGLTYGMNAGETIELWAEWNYGVAAPNPRFKVEWGDGSGPDVIGCGSCLLTHRYLKAGLFSVSASLDDRVSTTVTRSFLLDSREAPPATPAGPGAQNFSYTGGVQTFTVPAGVTLLHVEAWGASGGTATNNGLCDIGGRGGHAWGDMVVTPGATLWIFVGGQGVAGGVGGWNGGGNSCENTQTCGSGGGASDIRAGGQGLDNRAIVAGGGGGAEYSGCSGTGGNGGGLVGDNGSEGYGKDGTGGTQSAGGTPTGGSYLGTSGTFGVGGTGGSHPAGHAGGGGAGWWGGAGSAEDGHGGGGSSYIAALTGSTGTTAGVQTGHGRVTITW